MRKKNAKANLKLLKNLNRLNAKFLMLQKVCQILAYKLIENLTPNYLQIFTHQHDLNSCKSLKLDKKNAKIAESLNSFPLDTKILTLHKV